MMMKFTCNTGELNQGINSALLAVSPKSTLLALEGILVRVTTKEITLMSYNLEMGITAIVDAKVEKTGEIIIPAKVFSDIIRRIESDEVTIEADDRCLVQITGGVSQFTILGMTSEEFPELPEVGEAQGFSIPMETLSSMVDMTRYAIATNDTKPVQTGCLFELQDDELVVVAVDGFRLALRREKVEHHEPMRFIVPGKTLGELLKLMGEEGNVVVEASRKHILFDMGNVLIRFEPKQYVKNAGLSESDQQLLLRELYGSIDWVRLDRGTLTEAEVIDRCVSRVGEHLRGAVEKLVGHWDRPELPVEGMKALTDELYEKGYGLYLLTNAGPRQREYWPRFRAGEHFPEERVYRSADVHLLKPDPAFFEGALEKFGLNRAECVFIDDSAANAEGAQRVGLDAIVFFGDAARLRKQLHARGVDVSE